MISLRQYDREITYPYQIVMNDQPNPSVKKRKDFGKRISR